MLTETVGRAVRITAMAVASSMLALAAGSVSGPVEIHAQTPSPGGAVPAPIEAVTVAQTSGQWVATVKSGLPSACAKFDAIAARQNGIVFDVTVTNVMNVPPGGACTMIYGTVTNSVGLASNLRHVSSHRQWRYAATGRNHVYCDSGRCGSADRAQRYRHRPRPDVP